MKRLKGLSKRTCLFGLFSSTFVVVVIYSAILLRSGNTSSLSTSLPYSPNSYLLTNAVKDEPEPPQYANIANIFAEKIRATLEISSDTVGWIHVDNTNVDFPVLQNKRMLTKNNGNFNDYYLKLNAQEKYDYYGSIFADYRNTIGAASDSFSKNTIIYGHTMYSRRNEKFGQLERFKKLDFVKENQFIQLATPLHLYNFKIFAAFLTDTNFNYISDNPNEEQFNDIVQGAKRRSKFNFDTEVNVDDKIITLSTCTYEFGMNTNVRWVIMGRLMLETEELTHSEVSVNSNPIRPNVRK